MNDAVIMFHHASRSITPENDAVPDDERIVSHDAFFQKHHAISQSWQIHNEIRSFSRQLFSHSISSKSKKITLFRYLT